MKNNYKALDEFFEGKSVYSIKKKTGIDFRTINRIRDNGNYRQETLRILLDAYGLEVDLVINEKEKKNGEI